MLNYIALYPNQYEDVMNPEIILGNQDVPIEDFVIMAMKELEAIDNIKIENIENIKVLTQFEKVIIPDNSIVRNSDDTRYYSKEYSACRRPDCRWYGCRRTTA